ncbi:MAG TPA: TetR/AcrR family transcriptional regulator [Burkholderiales bacterium]|nr:TetR/AcrR family transcriptional regulator [Burkholderiales bacterium]
MARPREYDRETVLTEAMNVFWGTGYFGTNMPQLIEATRLKPGSLYGAFSSKEALFLAALDHYGQKSVESVKSVLNSRNSPIAGVREWVGKVASEVAKKSVHSCLLVNSAIELGGRNSVVREKVNLYLDEIRKILVLRLEQARDVGEISSDKDPDALAAFVLCTIWGLRVLGETSPEKAKVDAVSNQLLALLEK